MYMHYMYKCIYTHKKRTPGTTITTTTLSQMSSDSSEPNIPTEDVTDPPTAARHPSNPLGIFIGPSEASLDLFLSTITATSHRPRKSHPSVQPVDTHVNRSDVPLFSSGMGFESEDNNNNNNNNNVDVFDAISIDSTTPDVTTSPATTPSPHLTPTPPRPYHHPSQLTQRQQQIRAQTELMLQQLSESIPTDSRIPIAPMPPLTMELDEMNLSPVFGSEIPGMNDRLPITPEESPNPPPNPSIPQQYVDIRVRVSGRVSGSTPLRIRLRRVSPFELAPPAPHQWTQEQVENVMFNRGANPVDPVDDNELQATEIQHHGVNIYDGIAGDPSLKLWNKYWAGRSTPLRVQLRRLTIEPPLNAWQNNDPTESSDNKEDESSDESTDSSGEYSSTSYTYELTHHRMRLEWFAGMIHDGYLADEDELDTDEDELDIEDFRNAGFEDEPLWSYESYESDPHFVHDIHFIPDVSLMPVDGEIELVDPPYHERGMPRYAIDNSAFSQADIEQQMSRLNSMNSSLIFFTSLCFVFFHIYNM